MGLRPTHGWEQCTGGESALLQVETDLFLHGTAPRGIDHSWGNHGRYRWQRNPLQLLSLPRQHQGTAFSHRRSWQLKVELGSVGKGNHLPATKTQPGLDGDAAAWSGTRHDAVSWRECHHILLRLRRENVTLQHKFLPVLATTTQEPKDTSMRSANSAQM